MDGIGRRMNKLIVPNGKVSRFAFTPIQTGGDQEMRVKRGLYRERAFHCGAASDFRLWSINLCSDADVGIHPSIHVPMHYAQQKRIMRNKLKDECVSCCGQIGGGYSAAAAVPTTIQYKNMICCECRDKLRSPSVDR